MQRKIQFTKMHGAGNDYIYVNTLEYDIADPSNAAVLWSDRHKGIGSDGLVLIGKSPVADADFSMRMFNADGSEGQMCGNASRCVGKYLYERKLTDSTVIRLYTLAGIKTLHLHVSGDEVEGVTVDMGESVLENRSQFVPGSDLSDGVFVSMGCPHYVVFTDDVDQVGVTGPLLERHPSFPERSNIDFVEVVDASTIRMRVWERGSGITMACGTGACASVVASCLKGKTERKCRVMMDGGELTIEWRESDNHLYMTGGATFVYDGYIYN